MKKYETYKKVYKILLNKEVSNSLKRLNKFKDINDMKSCYKYKFIEEYKSEQEALKEFKKTFEDSEVEYDREWNEEKGCYDTYVFLTKYFLVESYENEIIGILKDSYLLGSQINKLDTEWLKKWWVSRWLRSWNIHNVIFLKNDWRGKDL